MFKEFKAFITKGNVVELAVAVIIGASFTAIISSFVDDVLTPLLLAPALNAMGVSDINKLVWGTVKYGNFIAAIIKFLCYAFVLFMMVRSINKLKKKQEAAAPPPTPEEITLLREIRDSLKK